MKKIIIYLYIAIIWLALSIFNLIDGINIVLFTDSLTGYALIASGLFLLIIGIYLAVSKNVELNKWDM